MNRTVKIKKLILNNFAPGESNKVISFHGLKKKKEIKNSLNETEKQKNFWGKQHRFLFQLFNALKTVKMSNKKIKHRKCIKLYLTKVHR